MRNYVHLFDICRAFKFAIDNWDSCKNETYNIGNDMLNMNKLQLAQTIQKQLPLEIIRAEFTQDLDKRDYVVSSQKFYNKGFEEFYSLRSNKGYGAKKHIEGIEKYGITKYHRKTFGICKRFA